MLASLCRRIASFALILILPATLIAQNAPASPAAPVPDPHMMTLLQDSKHYGNALTIIETDGTHIHGVVTAIDADSIQLSVTYGTPVTRIPFSQIAGFEHPPRTHPQKVGLGILIALAVAGIGGLIAVIIKFHQPPAKA